MGRADRLLPEEAERRKLSGKWRYTLGSLAVVGMVVTWVAMSELIQAISSTDKRERASPVLLCWYVAGGGGDGAACSAP